jgi:ADP-ribosyl-[dinitrogen reductase] hydrolase
MRVLPIALATIGQTEEVVRAACKCLLFMVQDALREKDNNYSLNQHVHPLAAKHPEFKFRAIKPISNPSGYVVATVQAVFQSFFDTDDFARCLIDVVNRGGDAETTGAIAGMLAGALYGLDTIPDLWLKILDTDIAHQCSQQAMELMLLN